MIVCLCGSARHKESFQELAAALALDGHIVLMPHVFNYVDTLKLTSAQKMKLRTLGEQQIVKADEIIIVTGKDNYIGVDTKKEICKAQKYKTPIRYMNYNAILAYKEEIKKKEKQ